MYNLSMGRNVFIFQEVHLRPNIICAYEQQRLCEEWRLYNHDWPFSVRPYDKYQNLIFFLK